MEHAELLKLYEKLNQISISLERLSQNIGVFEDELASSFQVNHETYGKKEITNSSQKLAEIRNQLKHELEILERKL